MRTRAFVGSRGALRTQTRARYNDTCMKTSVELICALNQMAPNISYESNKKHIEPMHWLLLTKNTKVHKLKVLQIVCFPNSSINKLKWKLIIKKPVRRWGLSGEESVVISGYFLLEEPLVNGSVIVRKGSRLGWPQTSECSQASMSSGLGLTISSPSISRTVECQ